MAAEDVQGCASAFPDPRSADLFAFGHVITPAGAVYFYERANWSDPNDPYFHGDHGVPTEAGLVSHHSRIDKNGSQWIYISSNNVCRQLYIEFSGAYEDRECEP